MRDIMSNLVPPRVLDGKSVLCVGAEHIPKNVSIILNLFYLILARSLLIYFRLLMITGPPMSGRLSFAWARQRSRSSGMLKMHPEKTSTPMITWSQKIRKIEFFLN